MHARQAASIILSPFCRTLSCLYTRPALSLTNRKHDPSGLARPQLGLNLPARARAVSTNKHICRLCVRAMFSLGYLCGPPKCNNRPTYASQSFVAPLLAQPRSVAAPLMGGRRSFVIQMCLINL